MVPYHAEVDRSQPDSQRLSRFDKPSRWIIVVLATIVLTHLLLTPHPLAIFGLASAQDSDGINDLIPDKVQHFVAYVVFTAVLMLCIPSTRRGGALPLAALATCHALITELLQQFVPDRFPDAKDFLADLLGITVGIGVVYAVMGFRRLQERVRIAGS